MIIFEKGFNYSQDGPGNRLVYHLQGCNMRCPWCSNPEGIEVKPPIMTMKGFIPKEYCDKGAIVDGRLDRNVCFTCNDQYCIQTKNAKIYQKAYEMTVTGMLEEIKSCRPLFFDGGGVTLTGGEVTVQFEEVLQLFKVLKQVGINTAIETNGTHKKLIELMAVTDHVMMDLKHALADKHLEYTGLPIEIVMKNLTDILKTGKEVLLRIPLISGINENDAVYFLERLQPVNCKNLNIEFLRYHDYGKDKWKACGYHYTIEDGKIKEEVYQTYLETFKEFNVVRT